MAIVYGPSFNINVMLVSIQFLCCLYLQTEFVLHFLDNLEYLTQGTQTKLAKFALDLVFGGNNKMSLGRTTSILSWPSMTLWSFVFEIENNFVTSIFWNTNSNHENGLNSFQFKLINLSLNDDPFYYGCKILTTNFDHLESTRWR